MLARAFSHAPMRRALITYALSSVAEFACYFAVLFVAFDEGGGAYAGAAAAAQLAPSVFVPLIIRFVDRRHVAPMRFALVWMFLSLATGVIALIAAPLWLLVVTASLRSLGYSLVRPIHLAVVPVHAEHTSDATAAMVVTGWIDAVGTTVGPAVAGLILGLSTAPVLFALMTLLVLMGVWLSPMTGEVVGSGPSRSHRSVLGIRSARSLLFYKTVSSTLSGATDVIVVLVAIELLGLGDQGAGYVASLVGFGELAGSLLLISLLGRVRLRGALGVNAVGRGAFVSFIGLVPQAFPALALSGVFRPAHRVVQRLMLQRITPPDSYMRMFGVSEAFDSAGQAAGAALVPLLVALLGVQHAIVVAGALLPLTYLALLGSFRDIDARAEIPGSIIELLEESPVFEGWSPDRTEFLARTMTPVRLDPGEVLVSQGDDHADAAWLVTAGRLDVVIDGERATRVERPDLVGEIALINSEPRSATVIARTGSELLRIDRETFLDVVVGGGGGGDHVRVLADGRMEENRLR